MTGSEDLKAAARALYDYRRAKRRGGPEDQRIVDAVESAMQTQASYHNGQQRMRMIRLKYILQTHTLQGAAMECNYSLQTVKRWNNELLASVASALICGDKKGPRG